MSYGGNPKSMPMKQPLREPHGFTLVELLVVIGIIAVLIGILLPSLNKARQQAYTVQCASTIRQFEYANQMYINDSRGFCLPAYQEYNPLAVPTLGGGARESNIWSANLAFRRSLGITPFTPAPGATTDSPLTTDFPNSGITAFANGYLKAGFVCPQATRLITNVISDKNGTQWFPTPNMYGMNVEGIDTSVGNQTTPWAIVRPTGPGVVGYRLVQVRRPAEKLLFVDAMCASTAAIVDSTGSGVFPGTGGKISNYDLVQEHTGSGTAVLADGQSHAYNATRMTCWRHRGGANVGFFDGHVAWLRKDEIYTYDSAGKIAVNNNLWKVMQ